MQNLAIVVTSCDSYMDDCARPFLTLLDRYWQNHPTAYWITETKHPAGFVAAAVNEPCWTKRVREALSKIEAEFVVFLCDDFFEGHRLSVEYEFFNRFVCVIDDCTAWRFINPSGFHANESVLNDIQNAYAVFSSDLV